MGRAGAGGAGGHHSSGGGHRAGRSSGGHRVGGSSGSHHRAGSGSFGGGFGGGPSRPSRPSHRPPMGGPGMPPPPPMGGPGMPPPPPPRRGYGYRRTYHGGNGMGCGGTIVSMMALVILCIVLLFAFNTVNRGDGFGGSSTASTIERTKLDTDNAYINDCVIDELGWFDSPSRTGGRLQDFWKETGVQPYIILKAYDPNLATDDQKTEWAEEYYDSHFDTENIFLYVYFGEMDADNDVGYMTYVNGAQTSSVMDSEAIEIFWNNIDKNWYSDMSTDDLFVDAFNSTGKTIMKVHRSKADVIKWVLIFAVVGVGSLTVVNLVKQKNKRAKEKAEEERRILETPIHDMAEDNLEQKYLQK